MGLISRVSSRTYRKNMENIDTEKCMLEVQDSIGQAEQMLAEFEKQGMDSSPTAEKIKELLFQLRSQRKKLLGNLPKQVKFTPDTKSGGDFANLFSAFMPAQVQKSMVLISNK